MVHWFKYQKYGTVNGKFGGLPYVIPLGQKYQTILGYLVRVINDKWNMSKVELMI